MLLDCYPRPVDLSVPVMSDPILRRMDWILEDPPHPGAHPQGPGSVLQRFERRAASRSRRSDKTHGGAETLQKVVVSPN